MSGRTGLRRARVLLALRPHANGLGQNIYDLAQEVGLKCSVVYAIVEVLQQEGLAADAPDGFFCLASGPHVAKAQAEARALLEARGAGA